LARKVRNSTGACPVETKCPRSHDSVRARRDWIPRADRGRYTMLNSDDKKARSIKDASRTAITDAVWQKHKLSFLDRIDGLGHDGKYKDIEHIHKRIRDHMSK
jgi:hypothetical protein